MARIEFTTHPTVLNRLVSIESLAGASGAADTIDVGDGTNYVIGGLGSDAISAGDGSNTILGDEGKITVDANGNFVQAISLFPTNGAADTFTLGQGTYRVIAGAGNENITVGPGTNYIIGDSGNIQVQADGKTLIETIEPSVVGNDTITASEGWVSAVNLRHRLHQ